MTPFKAFFFLLVLCSVIIQPNPAAMDATDTQTKTDATTGLEHLHHFFGHHHKLPPKYKQGHPFFHMPRLLPPSCPKHCKCPPPPPPPCPNPDNCKCPPKKKPKPPPPCPKHCRCPIRPPPPPKCPKCKNCP